MDKPCLGSRRDGGATVDPIRAKPCANGFRQLGKYVWLRVIHDGVRGVKTQAIEVILFQPVKRIVNEEIADGATTGTVEIDSIAPRRAMASGKKLGSVGAQVIPFGPEVVVHHIQKQH